MEFQATDHVLLLSFILAFILGLTANLTNFCTMGAISDWVNMGKTGRMWAWFVAIGTAMLATMLIEGSDVVSLNSTIPPYRTANFAWLRYLVGGLMFGIGMTFAGGCANKNLLSLGSGNMKSLLVFIITGYFAYLMTKTDFYATLFYPWVSATTIDLGQYDIQGQGISHILAAMLGIEDANSFHYALALILGSTLIIMGLASKAFTHNPKHVISGFVIGLVITGGWYISGGPLGQEALDLVEWMDDRPFGVGVQSYTFINPMGETLYYLAQPENFLLITFGMVAIAGVLVGSFTAAMTTGKLHLTWFTSKSDFFKHVIGAILMGIGGVLAMGCTIGQGITGVSTLALGSIIVLASIIYGSALTMKIMFYQMMYEGECGFMDCLLSSLVDLKTLPEGMRRLEQP
ncbi:MAG: YeeE/YedE family protein [Gammaproteobacteria bacterium]|nr:YeeE/YedE family protein [Gammaproteobacteria bacterium]